VITASAEAPAALAVAPPVAASTAASATTATAPAAVTATEASTVAGPAATTAVAGTPAATPAPVVPADSGTARGAAGGSALFIQAGAFSDPANAQRLAEKLRSGNYGKIFVRDDQIAGRKMYRVRIGPVPDVAEFDRVIAALERAGINDAHLALD
jgi:rare lipoprotein A